MVGIVGDTDNVQIVLTKTAEYEDDTVETVIYENKAELSQFVIPEGATMGDYVDVSVAHTAVLGKDGYYHLDSANGPILVVDLNYAGIVLSDALTGGRGIMLAYVENADGSITKYDIGAAVKEYEAVMDRNGYYPLTEDLILFYEIYATDAGVWSFNEIEGESVWMYCMRTMTLPEPELPSLLGMTMTLGNSLAANFVIGNAQVTGTGYVAEIVKEYADGTTKTVEIPQSQWQKYGSSGYYFTFYGVFAKEMTDLFTVNVYNADGEKVVATYVRSIEGYCYDQIVKEEGKTAPNAENLALYVDILKYGAAAQDYFDDYNIGNLATARLSEAQLAYGTETITMTDIRVKGTGYLGSTLSLKNEISMNFVFANSTINQAAYATISFTNHYGELKEKTVQAADFQLYGTSGKFVIVDGMAVADCSEQITVTLYTADGTVLSTNIDSVEAYIARMSNADVLYPAIMKLATSAYNYFH